MMKKFVLWLLLALCTLVCLTGCSARERVLLTPAQDGALTTGSGGGAALEPIQSEDPPLDENDSTPSDAPTLMEEPEQDAPTQDDPNAQRREYAADASAALTPDAERIIWVQTEIIEAPAEANMHEAPGAQARQMDEAPLTLTETLTRDEAERLGVSEQAPRADTSYQYYQAMLESRLSSMFECERLYVYWETPVDYQTVFKTSDAHRIITLAGGYDVSAKRLEDALMVDDGWIGRKNPGCVVKCVDAHVLGEGVQVTAAAGTVYSALIERPGWTAISAVKSQTVLLLSSELLDTRPGQLAAALYLAKAMYPDTFADLNPNEAWQLLRQEGTGTAAGGVYAYTPERGQ